MSTIDEISALQARSQTERRSPGPPAVRGIDVKRDAGGIREIELFVQILQLLYGGRLPQLRTASLLTAIDRLQFIGVLPQVRHDQLRAAYLFLRRLENRLQAVDERQTHSMPLDAAASQHLARLMGLRSAAGLLRLLGRSRALVRRLTGPLFAHHTSGSQARRAVQSRRDRQAQLALQAGGPAQAEALQRLGFSQPAEAQGVLAALCRSLGSPFAAQAAPTLRPLAAALLADIATSPDPHQALRLYADLEPALRRQRGYLQMLWDTPLLRRRLIDLMGSSAFLGRTIIAYPELIDWFAAARDPAHLLARSAASILVQARQRLAQVGPASAAESALETHLRCLRRFKLQEQLRLGMLDLAGTLDLEAVQAQLSHLAEACLRLSLELAADDLGLAPAATAAFCVLGMGRLGSAEMGYGSDLDLLFVYDAAGIDSRQAHRLAQRLIHFITAHFQEGPLYAIDTRLRPSGSQGPLVVSQPSFLTYYRARAMLWECQALLRARPVAGAIALGSSTLAALQAQRYPPRLGQQARQQIHLMRQRIAAERGGSLDVKAGRGGLVDIEFVVQYLQLRYAGRYPALRQTATASALLALGEAALLSRRRCSTLLRAYQFLRRLEARLRIVHDRPISTLTWEGEAADMLARRLDLMAARRRHPGQRLQRLYLRHTAAVARIYDTIMNPSPRPQPRGGPVA